MSAVLTMTIDEISQEMGVRPSSLMRRHKRLSRDHGFPPPLPGGVWRWSRAAFEAWVRSNGTPPKVDETGLPATANEEQGLRLVAEQNRSLRDRYAGRGR